MLTRQQRTFERRGDPRGVVSVQSRPDALDAFTEGVDDGRGREQDVEHDDDLILSERRVERFFVEYDVQSRHGGGDISLGRRRKQRNRKVSGSSSGLDRRREPALPNNTTKLIY